MESDVDECNELFIVDVRKYQLDEGTPWYERAFFRAVYLPFVRFAHRYFHIPAQGTKHPDGSFSWVENIGIATSEAAAQEMCKGEFYKYTALPIDSGLPKESVHYKGHVYPNSIMPDRYRRRTFRYTPQPTEHLALLHESVTKLGKALGK